MHGASRLRLRRLRPTRQMGLRGWNGVAGKARIGIGDLGTDVRTTIAALLHPALSMPQIEINSTLTIIIMPRAGS